MKYEYINTYKLYLIYKMDNDIFANNSIVIDMVNYTTI